MHLVLLRLEPLCLGQNLFGAVRPDYLHMLGCTVPIYDSNRHKLCRHNSRQEEIDCCEEFCMDRIRVNDVLDKIKSNL